MARFGLCIKSIDPAVFPLDTHGLAYVKRSSFRNHILGLNIYFSILLIFLNYYKLGPRKNDSKLDYLVDFVFDSIVK